MKPRRIAIVAERTNGFSRAVIEGIAEALAPLENWTLDLLDPGELPAATLNRFDGFISRLTDERTAERLGRLRRPVVETANFFDVPDGFVRVLDDATAIGRIAAEHFTGLHHTHFAYCGFDGLLYSQERGRTFAAALRRSGKTVTTYASAGARIHRSVADASPLGVSDAKKLVAWLKSLPRPTALFCCNDRRAFQIVQLCRENGLRIPQDLSVCGVDNDIVLCTFLSPRITSIDPDARGVGRRAVASLAGLFGERGFAKCRPGDRILVPPAGVVTRSSTALYPVDPPWLANALRFIRQHTGNRLTASDVCAFVGKSNATLNAVLRRELGSTVQKEIAATRLELAKSLLLTEDLPIRQIGLRAGFASAEYFCRCFTAAVGIAPRAYRKSKFPA